MAKRRLSNRDIETCRIAARECLDRAIAAVASIRESLRLQISDRVFYTSEVMASVAHTIDDYANTRVLESLATGERISQKIRSFAMQRLYLAMQVASDHGYQTPTPGLAAAQLAAGTVPPLRAYASLTPSEVDDERLSTTGQPITPTGPEPARVLASPMALPRPIVTTAHVAPIAPVQPPASAPQPPPPQLTAGRDLPRPPITGIPAEIGFPTQPPCPQGTAPQYYGGPGYGPNDAPADPPGLQWWAPLQSWYLCASSSMPMEPPRPVDGAPPEAPCPPPPCMPICAPEEKPPESDECATIILPVGNYPNEPPPPYNDRDKYTWEKVECPGRPAEWHIRPVKCPPDESSHKECEPDPAIPPPPAPPPEGSPVPCVEIPWPIPATLPTWTDARAGCVPIGAELGQAWYGAFWWSYSEVLFSFEDRTGLVYNIVRSVGEGVSHALRGWGKLVGKMLCVTGCDTHSLSSLGWAFVYGIATRWLGFDYQPIGRGIDYLANTCCPNLLPDLGTLLRLFYTDRLKREDMQRAAKAIGFSPGWTDLIIESGRFHLTADQMVDLWRRDRLSDESLTDSLKRIGIWDENERDAYIYLGQWVIPPTDLIRLMQRDVFDKGIVEEERLWDEFPEKYGDDAQAIGRANGVSVETMRHYWAAHWHYPSPTQLYTMLHRLRPGRTTGVQPVVMDDVLRVLAIDDVAPIWRERLAAISYATMRLVDIRKAYCKRVIDKAEAKAQLLDRGQTDRNADITIRLWDEECRTVNKCNVKTLRQSYGYKSYVAALITWDAAVMLMTEITECFDIDWSLIRVVADQERQVNLIRRIVSRVNRAVHRGVMSPTQATTALLSAGLDNASVVYHSLQWELPDPAEPRLATVSDLKRWCKEGIITQQQFYIRLRLMNFPHADAYLIVRDCGEEIEAALQEAFENAETATDETPRRRPRRTSRLGRGSTNGPRG